MVKNRFIDEKILEAIEKYNTLAKKAATVERAVIRVSKHYGDPELFFPDTPANLGRIESLFLDGGPHYGEASFDYYYSTKPLSAVKKDVATFLDALDRLIEYNTHCYQISEQEAPKIRIYLRLQK
jgi:hypothetical protein